MKSHSFFYKQVYFDIYFLVSTLISAFSFATVSCIRILLNTILVADGCISFSYESIRSLLLARWSTVLNAVLTFRDRPQKHIPNMMPHPEVSCHVDESLMLTIGLAFALYSFSCSFSF